MGRGQRESSALSLQKKASSYFTQRQRAMPAFEPGYFPLFGGRGLRGCSLGFWQRVGNLTHPLPAHSLHPKARTAFQRARTKGAQKCLEERGCVPPLPKPGRDSGRRGEPGETRCCERSPRGREVPAEGAGQELPHGSDGPGPRPAADKGAAGSPHLPPGVGVGHRRGAAAEERGGEGQPRPGHGGLRGQPPRSRPPGRGALRRRAEEKPWSGACVRRGRGELSPAAAPDRKSVV